MRRPIHRAALLSFTALLFIITPGKAHAVWSTNTAINNLVWYSGDAKAYPANVSDGTGGAIVMWYGPASSILVQHINAVGVTQGSVAIIPGLSQEIRPVIVSDDAGGVIIAWSKVNNYESYNNDIYAQRVDGSGAVLWTTSGTALCTAAGNQLHPTIAADHAGGAIITWQDYRNSPEPDIYAQRVDASGSILWAADGVAVCTATSYQTEPAIAADNAGGAIITWTDLRRENGYFDIYAQHVNGSGAGLWMANGIAICVADDEQSDPNIISDGFGGAIIAWQDFRNAAASYYDIYAQRVSAEGNTLWTNNGQAICATADYEYSPEIASDGSGGAIFTWWKSYVTPPYEIDICAQRINAAGSVQWGAAGVPICTLPGWQNQPVIIKDGAGGAIITWTDYRVQYPDIYAQRINAAGAVQWTGNGVAIATASPSQSAPTIAGDGTGGAIISWMEQRGIYASQIGGNGILGSRASASAVGPAGQSPKVPVLSQNCPNPFNPRTSLRFDLPQAGYVRLSVFDVAGRVVRTLVDEGMSQGSHEVAWDGLDSAGRAVGSGTYLARLSFGGRVETVRMGLVR